MALVQLELLHQIEQATGKKITELFQWIVASGIGGLLILVMVYGTLQYTI
jgi:patatin-like phospholipase/acyl hydrolase